MLGETQPVAHRLADAALADAGQADAGLADAGLGWDYDSVAGVATMRAL